MLLGLCEISVNAEGNLDPSQGSQRKTSNRTKKSALKILLTLDNISLQQRKLNVRAKHWLEKNKPIGLYYDNMMPTEGFREFHELMQQEAIRQRGLILPPFVE